MINGLHITCALYTSYIGKLKEFLYSKRYIYFIHKSPMETSTQLIIDQIKEEGNRLFGVILEIKKAVVGQEHAIDTILNAILCGGHILLEGVPGVAKTTMIKAVAKTLGLSFNRLQFTPDLLPADLIGTLIYNPKTQEFDTKK